MAENNYFVLMGTKGGPAIRPGSSMPTSNYLSLNGNRIVIDCGLGVTKGLVDQGVNLNSLSHIFITHLHSDHYLELGPLIHTAWTAGLKTSVDVYGPAGIQAYWDNFNTSMQADIELRIEDEGRPVLHDLLNIHVIDEGNVMATKNLVVDAMRVQHPPLIDCFALSFKSNGTHVVCSGDTAPLDSLAHWANDCDLLIHEAMLEAALPALFERIGNVDDRLMKHWLRSHTFAHDVGKLATLANAKSLALTHLVPADDPDYGKSHWEAAVRDHWDGELHIGHDGLVIPLSS